MESTYATFQVLQAWEAKMSKDKTKVKGPSKNKDKHVVTKINKICNNSIIHIWQGLPSPVKARKQIAQAPGAENTNKFYLLLYSLARSSITRNWYTIL